ncbi:hypothetical protein TVAG_262070 [Trichomonas vaginalis G3]|uniref:Uncharacterized protein n=1 Tax=Trichomonas vaginalis (strain ATCC PRA-98 / G3) TaxID=412133 RepID=A2DUB9_TRIV3|nr:hypothetical protein TVAGG3_0595650 [Trichomonas vaginalis G3]EAY15957.1 hypothetical protein TVAG_262070 [Trichomonas vaginalis G3]KAI5523591.1 hypothetical protein TVAGG3_0595650 [Trichomonas vaginalis G3]|eukprot:XP_001328180.1 hypothetical protein [Trichomonas vaginalis G3]
MESSTLGKEMDDLDRLLAEDTQIKEAKEEARKEKIETIQEEPKHITPQEVKKEEEPKPQTKPVNKPKKQRKPQMKISLQDLPLDNLPNLVIPTPNISPIPTATQPPPQSAFQQSIITNFEERILKYLDNSLKSLSLDLTTQLNNFFQKSDDIEPIISTFRKGLMSDIQRELQIKVNSISPPMIPFNVGIELPHQQTTYSSMQDTIMLFKAQNSSMQMMMNSTINDYKKAVHDRNKVLKKTMVMRQEMKKLKSETWKKSAKAEFQLLIIKNKLESIKNRSESLRHKNMESESLDISIQPEISTDDFIYELNSFLPELNRITTEPSDTFDKVGQLVDDEIQDIHKRRFTIESTTQDLCTAFNDYISRLTPDYQPTLTEFTVEDLSRQIRSRLNNIDPNSSTMQSPKKKSYRSAYQTGIPQDKFTLPLASYLYK